MLRCNHFLSFLISVTLLLSCKKSTKIPDEIIQVLEAVGPNQTELRKVFEHYQSPSDSLKLKAAYFMVANLKDRYFYQSKLIAQYADYLRLIRKDDKKGDFYLKRFNEQYGPFVIDDYDKKHDLEIITAQQLIDNIEIAFKAWRSQPWGKDISFENFCEYILPYKLGDEAPVDDRESIYQRFQQLLLNGNADMDAVGACQLINDSLRAPQWIITNRVSFLPTLGPKPLLEHRVGTCRNMTDMATYVMRACGIPVTSDFIPQWPYRNGGHDWNVVMDKKQKARMFLGAEDSPNTPHKPFTKKGKVYRRLFSPNPNSLAMIKSAMDEIPPFLRDPRIYDVTDEYAATQQVKISIKQPDAQQKYAYLCVYNNKDWVPVAWSHIGANGETQFDKVEGNIVYVIGYYINSKIVNAGLPFLLNKAGGIKTFQMNANKNMSMTVDRIYPVVPDAYWVHDLVGGVFQGANRPDFGDAETLAKITLKPFPYWNSLETKSTKKYQYVRYLSHEKQHCFMGELAFYGDGKKRKGEIISSDGLSHDDLERPFTKAFDGDTSTFFDARRRGTIWFGLKFEKAESIAQIRFSPALNDVGRIKPDHEYELFYLNEHSQWISQGVKTAKAKTITFENIPTHTFYRLENRTKKANARLFTYDFGKASWW